MRLNNSIKQAFVKSVLDDSALVDYTTQITDRVKKYFYDIAPADVKKVYDNPKTQKYISSNSVSMNYGSEYLGWFSAPLIPIDCVVTDMDLLAELAYLKKQENEQQKKRWELETKLRGVIDSFTTVKTAREALPEFAKYLPEVDGSRCKTLPAIAGLVADLQNIGWKPAKTA
jgi:hypothetical protein